MELIVCVLSVFSSKVTEDRYEYKTQACIQEVVNVTSLFDLCALLPCIVLTEMCCDCVGEVKGVGQVCA